MPKKYTIVTVFGTRPEAIKMAPVVLELQKHNRLKTIVAVSAQHRSMLDQVLEHFGIVPDFDLNIMKPGQTLEEITSAVLLGMGAAFAKVKPDMVLVHGDTTTTMASALAAYYAKIPVGHVEAGLRTGNKYSPFPEEVNRQIVSRIAGLNFAPTALNRENLIKEGVAAESITVTGNTVIDALLMTAKKDFGFNGTPLGKVDFDKKVLLVTCHRRENWGEPMRGIFSAIRDIVLMHPDVEAVFPVHSNPIIVQASREILAGVPRIHLVPPLEYPDFCSLMAKSHIVLSDSGGVQEEAPALGKPVLVLRTTTERPEAVWAGTVRLVGVKHDDIVIECSKLLEDEGEYAKMAEAVNPYGDGKAAERVVSGVLRYFGLKHDEVGPFAP